MHTLPQLGRAFVWMGSAILCPILWAQAYPASPSPNVWEEPYLVTLHSEGRSFRLDHLDARNTQLLQGPEGLRGGIWKQGAAWGTKRVSVQETGSETRSRELQLLRWTKESKAWTLVARMKQVARKALPYSLAPLGKKDRFLGMSPSGEMFGLDRQYSPLAVFRKNAKDELELESLIAFPTKEPIFTTTKVQFPKGETVEVPRWSSRYATAGHAMLPTPWVVGSFYVVPWLRPGWFWVLSAEDGRIKRLVQLFDSVKEEDLGKSASLEMAVLGLQPTRDGRLLIASRDEFAVRHSMEIFDTQISLARFKAGQMADITKRQEEALKACPALEWWHLDPEEGRIYAVPHPLNTPREFTSLKMLNAFRFCFQPDGNLRLMDSVDSLFTPPSKTDGR